MTDGLHARFATRPSPQFRLQLELDVTPGETVALLGPNGAGKTTAVWALAGIIPIEEGRITLGGRVLEDPPAGILIPPEDRRIGAVFQDVLLFPHLSVLDNVAFAVRNGHVSRKEALPAARRWLETFGLGDLADLPPRRLSGGQAQLVGLARALATEPRMLLLDEPLSALDVATRAQVRRVLHRHLASFPGPRLLITHDPAEAFLLADRVVVIESGSVTQTGTPSEIARHPNTRYAADLAGVNLLRGTATAGRVHIPGAPDLELGDPETNGDVLVTIHPRAVSIHAARPEGSPRNLWESVAKSVETLGERCRVQFEAPLPLTVEITAPAQRELELEPGKRVWLAVKAAEIDVRPD